MGEGKEEEVKDEEEASPPARRRRPRRVVFDESAGNDDDDDGPIISPPRFGGRPSSRQDTMYSWANLDSAGNQTTYSWAEGSGVGSEDDIQSPPRLGGGRRRGRQPTEYSFADGSVAGGTQNTFYSWYVYKGRDYLRPHSLPYRSPLIDCPPMVSPGLRGTRGRRHTIVASRFLVRKGVVMKKRRRPKRVMVAMGGMAMTKGMKGKVAMI